MYHTKSMEYIWVNPRDSKSYEKSDSRVGENATFGENGRFAWDIRQKKRGGHLLSLGAQIGDSCSRAGENQVLKKSDECIERNGGDVVGGEQP